MTMSASLAVLLTEAVMGLTANERWKALQKIDKGGGIMTSKSFTIAMAIVLGCSVIALVVVSLYRKAREYKSSSVTASGPAKSVEKLTLAAKTGDSAKVDVKPADDKSADVPAGKRAFIAMFPFARKPGQAGQGRQVPEFTPAFIAGVNDRVVSIETTLPANVGDRVLVVLESKGAGEGAPAGELIEDIGIIRQSIQPAESIKAPNGRRLAVALTGLSDAQAAQLNELFSGAKAAVPAKENTAGSQDADAVLQAVVAKEEIK